MERELITNYCSDDHWNNNGHCVLQLVNTDGEDGQIALKNRCYRYNFVDDCIDSSKLQMTIQDYNLNMAVTSQFLGFTLVFLVGFLFVLQGRR